MKIAGSSGRIGFDPPRVVQVIRKTYGPVRPWVLSLECQSVDGTR